MPSLTLSIIADGDNKGSINITRWLQPAPQGGFFITSGAPRQTHFNLFIFLENERFPWCSAIWSERLCQNVSQYTLFGRKAESPWAADWFLNWWNNPYQHDCSFSFCHCWVTVNHRKFSCSLLCILNHFLLLCIYAFLLKLALSRRPFMYWNEIQWVSHKLIAGWCWLPENWPWSDFWFWSSTSLPW